MKNFTVRTFKDTLSKRDLKEYQHKSKILTAMSYLNRPDVKGVGRYTIQELVNMLNRYLEIDSLPTIKKRRTEELINELLATSINGEILLTKKTFFKTKASGGGGVVQYFPSPNAKALLRDFFAQKSALQKQKKVHSLRERKTASPIIIQLTIQNGNSVVHDKRAQGTDTVSRSIEKKAFKTKEEHYAEKYKQAISQLVELGTDTQWIHDQERGIISNAYRENMIINLSHFLAEIPKESRSKARKEFINAIKSDITAVGDFRKGASEYQAMVAKYQSEHEKDLERARKEKELRQKQALARENAKAIEEAQRQVFEAKKEELEASLSPEEMAYKSELECAYLKKQKEVMPYWYPERAILTALGDVPLLKVLRESRGIELPHSEKFAVEPPETLQALSSFSFFSFTREGRAI